MSDETISRQLRIGLLALFTLALLAVLLFGRIAPGAGFSVGIRQRVIMILQSANRTMGDLGITALWREIAWGAAILWVIVTLALIWIAMRPTDDAA
jgi:hypothetical protein